MKSICKLNILEPRLIKLLKLFHSEVEKLKLQILK
jgi:hypothetical protein